MPLQSSHIYVITNFKAGNVVELSDDDSRTVIGFDYHGSSNQKWKFEQVDGGPWTIRSVSSGKYLGVGGDIRNGEAVIAVDKPYRFDVLPDDKHPEAYRIYVHDTQYNIDLYGGDPIPRTPVIIWGKWPGDNQVWRLSDPL
ncbi:carbohydrate-binding module family 13 protein [Auriscalpium vulgare]|uniref:Carbohydrate-binding module family 13 protein n=1 Tax=Auriscalpium vulgare TaxID=40419 RepID=A0ACB8RQ23_9AGAM|nr:carbohydrate-binding module family 13 protein [Auriscalpium vulgare]